LPARMRPSTSRNRARCPSRGSAPSPVNATTAASPPGRTRRGAARAVPPPMRRKPPRSPCPAGRSRLTRPRRPTPIGARCRRPRWRGARRPDQAITVEEPSTLPVARKRPVAGERHDRGLAAGSHPSRSSTRRATADEAKSPEQPVPGGAGRARSGRRARPRSVPGAGDRGGAALAIQGESVAVDERRTCSSRRAAPSQASTPDAALVARAHPPRRSKRRATADEAKTLRPEMPRRGRRSRRQGKET